MVKADLITGFLGSGKTTFIRKYITYLTKHGETIGIIENDYGAVNVDRMLLADLESDSCELEMVAGGCDADCHKRRFKTKMIAMGMCGYNRVIVEPSGIYDTDEFFDTLCEEPICNWYTRGSVITIVDARPERSLTTEGETILASQLLCAGLIVFSHVQQTKPQEIDDTLLYLNEVLKRNGSKKQIDRSMCLIKDWDLLDEEDMQRIMNAGCNDSDLPKLYLSGKSVFQSLCYMDHTVPAEKMEELARTLLKDTACGEILRVKGFAQKKDGGWVQLNAKEDSVELTDASAGQKVFIVIGANLSEETIAKTVQRFASQTSQTDPEA